MTTLPTVRPLRPADLPRAVALHEGVLHMEFLTRLGGAFLRRYYLAWAAAPDGISLVAADDEGQVVGVLLGATDPVAHVRAMLRRHGAGLALQMVAHAVRHPQLGAQLVATRARRYAGGVWRSLTAPVRHRAGPSEVGADGRRVGEITHLLVDPERQGAGIGRALVDEAMRVAAQAGVAEIELVTPPDLEAVQFYERLGWRADGAVTSRSGEHFVRFRHAVGPPGDRTSSDREARPD